MMTHFKARLIAAVACLAPMPALALDDLSASVEADYQANLQPLFEHFHRNPELSFLETETAGRLASELRALGYDVTEGVGVTGVVAVMRNGEGPTVLIRADMDGLPVAERSGLSYASTARQIDPAGVEQAVMHACGHDVHMTALVGTARQLAARKDAWSGTLVLIGQPAEERIMGAKAMLDDGLYTRFPKPEYALALHVSAQHPAGKLQVEPGAVYSSSDSVDIFVKGVGAHGASPHRGVDPVLTAAHIVVALQSLVSRSIDPLQPGVVTVGSIHGGTKHNIIGEEVTLELTIRSNDPQVRETLLDGVDRIAANTARALGTPEDKLPVVVRREESTPPTVNDAETAARVKAAFLEAFREDKLTSQPRQGMGAEDFAYLVAPEHGVKGVYFAVGGTPEGELATAASHHSPLFKIEPHASVTASVEGMTVAALALLGTP